MKIEMKIEMKVLNKQDSLVLIQSSKILMEV